MLKYKGRLVPVEEVQKVELYVQALGEIVSTMPRDKNTKTGESKRGLRPGAVAGSFYEFMATEKDPLAKVRPFIQPDRHSPKFDEQTAERARQEKHIAKPDAEGFTYVDCTAEKPCGKCNRCVYAVHSYHAEHAGLIHVQGFKGEKVQTGRSTHYERGYVRIYKPGEIQGGNSRIDHRNFAQQVRANLGLK